MSCEEHEKVDVFCFGCVYIVKDEIVQYFWTLDKPVDSRDFWAFWMSMTPGEKKETLTFFEE